MNPTPIDWRKYFVVFVITVCLFGTAFYLSSYFNNRKVDQLKSIQDKISVDIASSETQFQLLQELSCQDVAQGTLTDALNDLAAKISYSEQNLQNQTQVTELKRYYSLLEIKDYLLVQKIKAKCGTTVIPIFYFYTTAENCSECIRQSAVLTELRDTFPMLRVYSFDYTTDLSALQSLEKIFKVKDTELPALVMNEHLYTGFHSIEDIEKILPELAKSQALKEKAAVKVEQ